MGLPAIGVPVFNTPYDDIRVIERVLTPTQIKAFDFTSANNAELIAAPGPGKYIQILDGSLNLQFNSVAYATGAQPLILYYYSSTLDTLVQAFSTMSSANIKSGASVLCLLAASSSVAANQTGIVATGTASNVNRSLVANISNATKYTAGDSNIVVVIRYRILSVS